ncbi:YfiT family bacillithiol transferase [Cohnella fermenti]|uniref:Putative metal-dependent hydrolase n=1 Tax=Cohnella fermenti TaxID=2565925 RepID=A0A4S4C9G0_9BACL|nr:putative metal-dependent hydrolase [Cohnella fermenti]THF84699.1 putative metal-dependent hydrolase [Cohnella fermenti]
MLDPIRYPIGLFKPVAHLSASDRKLVIAQMPEITTKLGSLLARCSPQLLDIPYRDNGWTVKQIVHHMADNDMNSYLRFKRALTEDKPMANSYREDLFAEQSDYMRIAVEDSLLLLKLLHKRFHLLLERLTAAQFQRTLVTSLLGEITLDVALQRFVWHGQHHTAQIENFLLSKSL